jgi:hypothetical protein
MSEDSRSAREAFWNVVPDEYQTEGCDDCENGWAEGPGLIYRCQCNPGQPGDPIHFDVGPTGASFTLDREFFVSNIREAWRSYWSPFRWAIRHIRNGFGR